MQLQKAIEQACGDTRTRDYLSEMIPTIKPPVNIKIACGLIGISKYPMAMDRRVKAHRVADSTSIQLADVDLASSLHTTADDLPEFGS